MTGDGLSVIDVLARPISSGFVTTAFSRRLVLYASGLPSVAVRVSSNGRIRVVSCWSESRRDSLGGDVMWLDGTAADSGRLCVDRTTRDCQDVRWALKAHAARLE